MPLFNRFSERQGFDYYEFDIMQCLPISLFLAYWSVKLEYNKAFTYIRLLRHFVKIYPLVALFYCSVTWATRPGAQKYMMGNNQPLTLAARMKAHFAEKYNWYEDADEQFIKVMQARKQSRAEKEVQEMYTRDIKPLEDAIVELQYKNYIAGKDTDMLGLARPQED